MWLCDKLGVTSESLGWRSARRRNSGLGRADFEKRVGLPLDGGDDRPAGVGTSADIEPGADPAESVPPIEEERSADPSGEADDSDQDPPDLDEDDADATYDAAAAVAALGAPGAWKRGLILNDKKKPRLLLANAVTALACAPEWHDILWFDEFHNQTMLRGTPPWSTTRIEAPWSDYFDNLATLWMQHQGVFVGHDVVGRAVWTVAHERPFHPVRDYLASCRWDGKDRLDDWLITYLGMTATSYIRAIGPRWMISGVARVLQPGCKADCMLVLEGPQGFLKSTALRVLADPWFADELGEFGTKDAALQLAGVWIVELSEIDAYTRSDVAKAKSFMSRPTDRFRPPYGTHVIKQPRQTIFGGTCNHNDYLHDETGGRRFWPGACGKIDIDRLAADRDQLWAEARDRFDTGESWWLDTPELNTAAEVEQAHRYQPDAWDPLISEYLDRPTETYWDKYASREVTRKLPALDSVTVGEILEKAIGMKPGDWRQPEQNRVARSLRALKWVRRRPGTHDREYRYFRP
jgi:predicted P-loop ATPase